MPRALRPLDPLPRPNAERSWVLGMAGTEWQISGRGFESESDRRAGRASAAPSAGRSSIARNRVHPMHIHGFLFRVVARSSGPRAPGERRGWKDTVGVLPDETVTVLAWFAPYAGRYVFHCHALEHADAGDDAAAGGGRDEAPCPPVASLAAPAVLAVPAPCRGRQRRRPAPSTAPRANAFEDAGHRPMSAIKAGDTVTWRFDGTQRGAQRAPSSANWSIASEPGREPIRRR